MSGKKFVKVCLNCGSTRLTHPAMKVYASKSGLLTVLHQLYGQSLLVPGVGELCGAYHCEKCGWTGVPIEVRDVKKFREHLKKKGGKKC